MKKFLIILLVLVIVILAGVLYYASSNKSIDRIDPVVSGPLVSPAENDNSDVVETQPVSINADLIKDAFVKAHGWDKNKLEITINKTEGNYASGGVRLTDEAGGGLWFAAIVNGEWQIVFDGNGIITCDKLANYPDFPKSMVPQCFDDINGEMIER